MTHYIEILFNPDDECPLWFLRNALCTKLHKAIFDLSVTDIGISFPQVNTRLGCVIRIHSTQSRLQQLQNLNWLGGLSGYCKVSEILPVPDKVNGYQTISRIRQTMSDAKLKKRIEYQKTQGILQASDDVKAYIKQYKNKMFATSLNNPYLELQSVSTNSLYRLYLQFGKLQNETTGGEFNRFGLSSVATVPIF